MNSPLDNLTGTSGALSKEPPDRSEFKALLAKAHDTRNLGEYEGDLNVDERLVTDLIVAAQAVAAKLQALPPP